MAGNAYLARETNAHEENVGLYSGSSFLFHRITIGLKAMEQPGYVSN